MDMDTHIVWILDQHVFALGLFQSQVRNGPDDSPTIVERHVHLSSKVEWLVRLHTDNDVALGVAGVGSGDVSGESQHRAAYRVRLRLLERAQQGEAVSQLAPF